MSNITYGRTGQVSVNQLLKVETEQGDLAPTFVCTADGYPLPNLTWSVFNNGQSLPFGVSTESSLTSQRNLLWNRALDYMDSGRYECTSQNTIGQRIVVLDLLVRCKYSIIIMVLLIIATSTP